MTEPIALTDPPPFSPRVQGILSKLQAPLQFGEVSEQLVQQQSENRKLTQGANEMLAYIGELENQVATLQGQLGEALARSATAEAKLADTEAQLAEALNPTVEPQHLIGDETPFDPDGVIAAQEALAQAEADAHRFLDEKDAEEPTDEEIGAAQP